MGKNKRRYIYITFSFVFVSVIIYIYNEMSNLSDIGANKEYSKVIVYKEINQNIYLKTKIWGLTGDHYTISLSDIENSNQSDKSRAIFYELRALYKQRGIDSLYIYLPCNINRNENIIIGKVKVYVNNLIYSEFDQKWEKYKSLGLSRVSVYDGIE